MDNKNRPAFPIDEETTDRINSRIDIYSGLTKLELAAIKAMQGILASYNGVEWLDEKRVAQKSIEYAKALLEELEKQ